MSIAQTTPFSLFLYENMDNIRKPFANPEQVIKQALEIWENMPQELKFIYFKKTHYLFVERLEKKKYSMIRNFDDIDIDDINHYNNEA
jgi:hypothetical protein